MTRYTDLSWEARSAIMADLRSVGCRITKGHAGNGFIAWCPQSPLNTATAIAAMSAHGFKPEGEMDHEESGRLIKFVPAV